MPLLANRTLRCHRGQLALDTCMHGISTPFTSRLHGAHVRMARVHMCRGTSPRRATLATCSSACAMRWPRTPTRSAAPSPPPQMRPRPVSANAPPPRPHPPGAASAAGCRRRAPHAHATVAEHSKAHISRAMHFMDAVNGQARGHGCSCSHVHVAGLHWSGLY